MENLKNFSKIKVLIVGDVMIDRYWWGRVERISPEAPVPVVLLNGTSLIAGGAANVASNIAGLGAQPLLVGIIGDDDEGKLFPKLLDQSNIGSDFLVKVKNRPTTVKTRIIAHSHQVARIDQESNADLTKADEHRIWLKIAELIPKSDIIILSDYAKGLLTENVLKRLITQAKRENKLVLVDPKGKKYGKYKDADILTPNQREVSEACGLEKHDGNSVEQAGKNLVAELGLKALLITRGEEGMLLLEKNKQPLELKALARNVYDVTGAGDTVIATLAVALCAGMTLASASELANIAAGLVVEQVGTTAIKIEELREAIKEF